MAGSIAKIIEIHLDMTMQSTKRVPHRLMGARQSLPWSSSSSAGRLEAIFERDDMAGLAATGRGVTTGCPSGWRLWETMSLGSRFKK